MPLTIEYLGHAGFMLSAGGHTLAIDPFLKGNPKAKRRVEELQCTAIAVTHAHDDHYGDVPAIAKRTGATVYCPFEIGEHLGELGHERVESMNPGGRVSAPFGWVALTQAFHSSSYSGRPMGVACGVVASIGGVTVYHTGDTALFSDMRLIGERHRPDVVIVPIGDRYTMGPEDAALAAEMTGARIAIPCHFNTWPPIEVDPGRFRPRGVEVRVLEPGETTRIEV